MMSIYCRGGNSARWHVDEPFPIALVDPKLVYLVSMDGDELLYADRIIDLHDGRLPGGDRVIRIDDEEAKQLITWIIEYERDSRIASRKIPTRRPMPIHTIEHPWQVWTNKRPTQDGWYWMRYTAWRELPAQIIQLFACDDTMIILPGMTEPRWDAVELAGPIPEPKR